MMHENHLGLAGCAAAFLMVALVHAAPASADAIERIRGSGTIKLGYATDARPFTFQDASGSPDGYAVDVCKSVTNSIAADSGVSSLSVEWVPVTVEERFSAVRDGKIDLLCGPDVPTLERRKEVSFSIPVFRGGIGALVRADASRALREVLSGEPPTAPTWRGSPARILDQKTFSAVAGSTSEGWLNEKLQEFHLAARVMPVDSYEAGVAAVLDRGADVFFADRAILVDAAQSSASGNDLVVIERLFTHEPVALALGRNDDDFRLAVDRALSNLYRSPEFEALFVKWFGQPSDAAKQFFQMSALPE